jgi:MFS family permease
VADAGSWEFEWPNRNLIFLSSMIFLLSIGEGLTAPAIPLFGLSLGARYWQLGLLMTGYGVAYTTMTMLAGRLSDYTGRKPMLMSSLVLSVIASLGYVLSRTINSLLVFRTVEGAGRGILWPVAEAAVADTVTAGDPGKAMGTYIRHLLGGGERRFCLLPLVELDRFNIGCYGI